MSEKSLKVEVDCYGTSHVGMRRSTNEDQFLIADLKKSLEIHQTSLGLNHRASLNDGSDGTLMIVADGLGGHQSGERASTLAVDGLANYILNAMDWLYLLRLENESAFTDALKTAFTHSQSMVEAEVREIPQRQGMATTLTMAYINWPKLYVIHVGDTRCYRIRDSKIERLTTDHNIAQLTESIFDAENLSGDPMATLPSPENKNALWNVIGGSNEDLEPEAKVTELMSGDAILLCSDGLTNYIEDSELLAAVLVGDPSQKTCDDLTQMANDRGGQDNITVAIARFEGGESEESTVKSKAPYEEMDTLPDPANFLRRKRKPPESHSTLREPW